MSGLRKKQMVTLSVMSKNIPFLPIGDYAINIYSTAIVKGSLEIKARVVDSINTVTFSIPSISSEEMEKIKAMVNYLPKEAENGQ